MKHIIIAIIAVLSVLHRDQLLATAKGCPRRYLRRINGKCYYFSVKKMNWYGALNNCLRKGLTLADLSNARDFYGAVEFLSSKGNTEDFWFGANDLQTEGRFQYISNGRLVRYFSNYSIVEPAEHSECDDCLEVRIRNNLTVVADDNCLERQYFICSERYCDVAISKPRHHSHEHLHHFHHDIGEASEPEGEKELNIQSPDQIEEQQTDNNESEEAANAETPENDDGGREMAAEGGKDTTPTAEEGETPAAGAAPPAEGGAGAAPPAEGGVTPAEEKQHLLRVQLHQLQEEKQHLLRVQLHQLQVEKQHLLRVQLRQLREESQHLPRVQLRQLREEKQHLPRHRI
ncbi:uncharacterized protein Dvir_GJ21514 [Drosophila virilis]|uniref:C-type lectin domain-containing protein n=1 Tax=Drosophila virilis TaxID=7244 RepID=B4LJB6_DROVI|nr:uncharacterized protein Dvir_GJ21514 [Drosophila virilis]